MGKPAEQDYLSVSEAASFLSVSPSTLRRWDEQKILKPLRTPGGQRRYTKEQLEAFIKNGKDVKNGSLVSRLQKKFLSISEAAKTLGVSVSTLRRWEKEKVLSPVRTPGGQRRYPAEDLRDLNGDKKAQRINLITKNRRLIVFLSLALLVAILYVKDVSTLGLKRPNFSPGLSFFKKEGKPEKLTPEYPEIDLTGYLPISGGTIEGEVVLEGKTTFRGNALFEAGASFGTSTLTISATGVLSTNQPIFVGGNKIITAEGKIPAITSDYFANLDASKLTKVTADFLDEFDSGDFLKRNRDDKAESTIEFVAKPDSTAVGGGPLYINPGSSESTHTLFGAAVGGAEKFRINAGGDTIVGGGLSVNSNTTLSADLAVDGGALTSTAGTFNLFNSTPTTINFGGAATSLTIGATSGTTTIRNAMLAISGLIDANGTGTHDIAGTLNLSGNTLTSSGDLTINAGGDDVVSSDRWTIGSNTAGVGQLTVTGAQVGKALVILNETGDQNILTASASGTTRMVLTNAGRLGLGTISPNATLEVAGAAIFRKERQAVSSSTTISQPNQVVGATAHSITVTLASSMLVEGNWVIVVDESGAAGGVGQAITIDTEGAETIIGNSSVQLNANYESVFLYTDGSDWFLIGNFSGL